MIIQNFENIINFHKSIQDQSLQKQQLQLIDFSCNWQREYLKYNRDLSNPRKDTTFLKRVWIRWIMLNFHELKFSDPIDMKTINSEREAIRKSSQNSWIQALKRGEADLISELINTKNWDCLMGHIWQSVNSMFKSEFELANPHKTPEELLTGFVKLEASQVSYKYQSFLKRYPTEVLSKEKTNQLIVELDKEMVLIAQSYRATDDPNPFFRTTPLLFYMMNMYILEKNAFYSNWSYDRTIMVEKEQEDEIRCLIETFYSQWYYVDAKIVEIQKWLIEMIKLPNLNRIWIASMVWMDPKLRPFRQLKAQTWTPQLSERVLHFCEPDLYAHLHDDFNRNRDELDYFYEKPLDTINRSEEDNKKVMDDWDKTQILLGENQDRARKLVNMRMTTSDFITLKWFFIWLQFETNRSCLDAIYIAKRSSHEKYSESNKAFSHLQPIFIVYDRFKPHLMYKGENFKGTIYSLISKWCDVIREIGGMIPITPEIFKLCGHMQDWCSSMPKYYSKDFIISSEPLNPECIIRGNRKSKEIRR